MHFNFSSDEDPIIELYYHLQICSVGPARLSSAGTKCHHEIDPKPHTASCHGRPAATTRRKRKQSIFAAAVSLEFAATAAATAPETEGKHGVIRLSLGRWSAHGREGDLEADGRRNAKKGTVLN